MKIYESCGQCRAQNEVHYTQGPPYSEEHYGFELTDSLIYEFTCKYGHNNIAYLQNQKYDILFHLGLLALRHGYSREAARTLRQVERFHEFSISVLAKEHEGRREGVLSPVEDERYSFDADVEDESNSFDAEHQEVWKLMSRQSERQYGAYLMLYFITFYRKPTTMNRKFTEFRNAVIHKGIFLPVKK